MTIARKRELVQQIHDHAETKGRGPTLVLISQWLGVSVPYAHTIVKDLIDEGYLRTGIQATKKGLTFSTGLPLEKEQTI